MTGHLWTHPSLLENLNILLCCFGFCGVESLSHIRLFAIPVLHSLPLFAQTHVP